MESSAPEDRALSLLAEVNGWLRYAEAKNGALLAVSTASTVGLLEVLDSVPQWAFWWIAYFSFCALISILAMLASFYAKVDTALFELFRRNEELQFNVFFFGHLAGVSKEALCSELGGDQLSVEQRKLLEDIAYQIIINSKIAQRKFEFFNFGLKCLIVALVTPIGLLLFHWKTQERH